MFVYSSLTSKVNIQLNKQKRTNQGLERKKSRNRAGITMKRRKNSQVHSVYLLGY
jgi:hypothetical protein